jgi:hypothetical protein
MKLLIVTDSVCFESASGDPHYQDDEKYYWVLDSFDLELEKKIWWAKNKINLVKANEEDDIDYKYRIQKSFGEYLKSKQTEVKSIRFYYDRMATPKEQGWEE